VEPGADKNQQTTSYRVAISSAVRGSEVMWGMANAKWVGAFLKGIKNTTQMHSTISEIVYDCGSSGITHIGHRLRASYG
jgi:hypothetical protein